MECLEVIHTATKTLGIVLKIISAEKFFQKVVSALQEYIDVETVSLALMRVLQEVVPRLEAPSVEAEIQTLMPCIFKAISHQSLVLRKIGVFLVVEMYFVIGETIFNHLEPLNAAQMKLVTMYIKRNEKLRDTNDFLRR